MTDEPIWTEDISILLQSDKIIEFIPMENMSFNQKLNSCKICSIFNYYFILLQF